MRKIYNIFLVLLLISVSIGAMAQDRKTISEARVYVNPGHGGWGSNDRPLPTINYAVLDTLGFFETNTNLLKGLELRDQLEKAGAYVKMSRTMNGIVSGAPSNSNEITAPPGQIVSLSEICADADANNMDYFISIHSNAATDGFATNFTLTLYRGVDAYPGNGLTHAKEMGVDAWKYVNKNDITYHSHYTTDETLNVRGDLSFYIPGTTETEKDPDKPLEGYLSALMHRVDGYLSEGCFHTYHPERHRLLNDDYCRQEGVRYARAIRAWFGDTSEANGSIMGTVKDKYNALTHDLYKYQYGSMDAYYPLNEVTVALQKEDGTDIASYKTDKEFNGVYVFNDLEPGVYKLVYDIAGFWKEVEEIEVVANETSFINKLLTDTSREEPTDEPEPEPEVDYYPHPEQDGDIVPSESYKFEKVVELKDVEVLKDLEIRRAILRDGKYYVLGVQTDKTPKLLVLNPETGELVKEMSTAGVVTTGFGGKEYPYILSDIAFTNDGVLLGANSTVVGKLDNSYQTGDFHLYKWQAVAEGLVEDATPEIMLTARTNTSDFLAVMGNNNSNFVANRIAVHGTIDNFKLFFDSHAGDAWNTAYGLNYMGWLVEDGVINSYVRNRSGYTETQMGADVDLTLSPTALDRLIIDGNSIVPQELQFGWGSSDIVSKTDFSSDITVASKGASYFRYAKHIYMAAPVLEKDADDATQYGVDLFDITDGMANSVAVAQTERVKIEGDNVPYMLGAGVVDNADIDLYMMVGANIIKFTTKGQEVAPSPARIFAYDLKSKAVDNGFQFDFVLNEDADSVELELVAVGTGDPVATISLGALDKGANSEIVLKNDLLIGDTEVCNWQLKVSAGSVTRLTKISKDEDVYKYFAPKSVAIDNSPESDYFGRVYVTNTQKGEVDEKETSTGIYALAPIHSDIPEYPAFSDGGVSWTGVNGEGPRKAAVAADGRVFIADVSISNAGLYVMNPVDMTVKPVFEGAVNNGGSLSIDGTLVGGQFTAVGVRGTGADLELFGVDKTASGQAWKKFVNVYPIGENNTWTTAPKTSGAASSYFGNDNNTIVPVRSGYWGAQYRGIPGHNAGNPALFYYSDEAMDVTFNSSSLPNIPEITTTDSENGGLAVNEKEGLIALSNEGGILVLDYIMKENTPKVTVKYWHDLDEGASAKYDDFEFDYAGNLYAVSNSGKSVSVWSMPTVNNTCVVPAKKSMLISKATISIEESPIVVDAVVYPTLVSDFVTVSFEQGVEDIVVYDATGSMKCNMKNVDLNEVKVDFSDMASGVYFIKINNAQTVKVIKK